MNSKPIPLWSKQPIYTCSPFLAFSAHVIEKTEQIATARSHRCSRFTGNSASGRKPKAISAEQIEIKKDLLYDKYTLEDTYPYKDTTRSFQWDKIKERLALLENIQQTPSQWGILQNYKNRNGEAPLVRHYKRNAYKRIADTLGIERYQSVPLYLLTDTLVPERYGEDGSLVRFLLTERISSRYPLSILAKSGMYPRDTSKCSRIRHTSSKQSW